ncbi:hypothetical protein POVWA2_055470 [Plasmodium ovale wallikeri]|uniref:Uncharacterized protein n=1 Tax=Plasmodium ovale wallikeri TaxID=864142 RepID=A0A1A8ZTJ8_PLAOA|nr:hypothetical protein POVWA1_055770 [Plasmodium ovale wallikeri]SBT48191.1 hypothetical protein POVWA2_055470 [Plasmodium ovale wallikeri]
MVTGMHLYTDEISHPWCSIETHERVCVSPQYYPVSARASIPMHAYFLKVTQLLAVRDNLPCPSSGKSSLK